MRHTSRVHSITMWLIPKRNVSSIQVCAKSTTKATKIINESILKRLNYMNRCLHGITQRDKYISLVKSILERRHNMFHSLFIFTCEALIVLVKDDSSMQTETTSLRVGSMICYYLSCDDRLLCMPRATLVCFHHLYYIFLVSQEQHMLFGLCVHLGKWIY